MVRKAFLPLVLALAVLLASCGSDGGSEPTADLGSATTQTTAGSEGGNGGTPEASGTVEIEHRFGTTEVPVRPKRIVSLDVQWTDVLVALGNPPAAYLGDPNAPDGYPWREGTLDDSQKLDAVDALPWEAIAAAQPDLIVVTYFATDQADYERLSAIAPTIASLTDEVDTWQDITTVAGKVLGDEQAATDLVAGVDAQVAAVGEDLPGLAGKTYAFANYLQGDSIWVLTNPDDGAAVLFDQLGLEITPTVLTGGEEQTGRRKFSVENLDVLDGDLLVLLTNGTSTDDIVGYDELPAVQSGAVALLDYVDVTALNTPSPLSIPYALDKIRPALEKAAAEG